MEYREELMAKAPSVRKNYIYNLIYQVMTLITPFITTPYISRVLGADGTGVQSYTNSVVQYFAILAALGTASYGQREIARHRDEIKIRSRLFWEIEVLCMATTAACLIIWLFVIGFAREYRPYYVVLTMTLLAVAFDISWFFGGLEQYSLIVLRNTAVKLVGIAMLFLFIREKEDLLLYVALTAATGLLGNVSMWGYLKGQVEKPVLKELRPLRHLKETLVYFIPTIATSVYTILDKTMLGWFSGENKSQNGYYEYATGFVNMAKILIMSFNAVMSARMSYLFGTGRMEEIHKRFQDSLDFVLLMAMPIMLGLAGIAAQFIPWFLGNGYLPVTFLMYVCSPLVLVVGLSDCIGSQILTPGGKRAQSGKVIVAGAMVNACLNFLLIPHFAALGAAAASVAAECFITSLYLWLGRDFIKLKMLVRYGWRRLVAAVIMLGAVVWTGQFLEQVRGLGPITTFVQIGAGAVVYFLVLLVMRDPFLYQYLGKIYRRLTGQP
jgi:O-antigen/teichoic acid export membrane protein